MTTPTNSALHMMAGQGARERVSAFLDQYATRHGLDPEEIHSLGTRDGIFPLNASDLRELCTAPTTALSHFADEVEASGEAEKHAVDEREQEPPVFHLRGYGDVTEAQLLELTKPVAPMKQEVDRSAAVNLARNMLTVRDCKGITSYGVRVLCEAVMTMDAAFSSPSGAGEAVAADDLDLIDAAISHLQDARSALNRTCPETATGRGYVQDARAALANVQP